MPRKVRIKTTKTKPVSFGIIPQFLLLLWSLIKRIRRMSQGDETMVRGADWSRHNGRPINNGLRSEEEIQRVGKVGRPVRDTGG